MLNSFISHACKSLSMSITELQLLDANCSTSTMQRSTIIARTLSRNKRDVSILVFYLVDFNCMKEKRTERKMLFCFQGCDGSSVYYFAQFISKSKKKEIQKEKVFFFRKTCVPHFVQRIVCRLHFFLLQF